MEIRSKLRNKLIRSKASKTGIVWQIISEWTTKRNGASLHLRQYYNPIKSRLYYRTISGSEFLKSWDVVILDDPNFITIIDFNKRGN